MLEDEFREYLSRTTNIDIAIINDMFDENTNIFDVAQKLIYEEGVDRTKLGEIWGNWIEIAYVDPNSALVNEDYVDMLGSRFIKDNNCLPLYKFGKAITVATSNPKNPFIQDKLEKKLGSIVSLVFCFPFDIERYMDLHGLK